MKKLGDTYPRISQARNAELRLRWGQIVLKNDHQEDFWKVRDFLQSQVGAPPCAPWPRVGGEPAQSWARVSAGRTGDRGQATVRPQVSAPWGAWHLGRFPRQLRVQSPGRAALLGLHRAVRMPVLRLQSRLGVPRLLAPAWRP